MHPNEITPLAHIKRHTLWLLVAFFIALTYFTGRNLAEKAEDAKNAGMISAWTETSILVNRLVHELQKERGLSSGLISSYGRSFDVPLRQQYQATDRAILHLEEVAENPVRQVGILAVAVRDSLHDLRGLSDLRARIDGLKISRDVAADYYTGLIERLFEQQLATLSVGRVGWIFRQQMAFVFFLQAKEMAGQERALLTAMLSINEFGPTRMAEFHRIHAVEGARLEKFVQLSDADVIAGLQEIQRQSYIAEIDQIRRLIVAVGTSDASNGANRAGSNVRMPSVARWFDLSTRKIDAMNAYETVLSDRLLQSAHRLEADAQAALWVNAVTVLISLLLAGMLLLRIRHGQVYAEKNLYLAAAVFDNSVEAIIVADADSNIIEVNRAFTQISGYRREEVLGQNPRIFKSGRHDREFYVAMWRRILGGGSWEGEIWNRRKDGNIYPALLSIVALKDEFGAVSNYIAMMVDLSKYKETEALLEKLRTFDPLTGLPNRDAWYLAVDQAVANARRSGSRFTILDIGLDRFKLINESLGHAVGDQVLVVAAENIKQALGRHEVAVRLGGDRFAILLPDLIDPQAVGAFCERLLAIFVPPVEVSGNSLHVSISIGVALYPDDGGDTRTLLKNAETALNGAKEEGRACYVFYSAQMNAVGTQMLVLERMLRQALENGEFSVAYQPQVDAVSGRLLGVEALLRWQNPTLGAVSPVQFIPVAEATGFIVPIGEWVLRESCLQARRWHDRFGGDLPVAVNLSARQFHRKDLLATVQLALDASGLPSRLLELEITEGLLMSDPVGAADIMGGLRHMGAKLALDDFGTGYSSLAYLKNFPLDRLKLDRAFVKDLPDNASDKAIARAVIALGHNLGLQVLAEGVETAAQAEFLAATGCDVFQGYFFGKPMTATQLETQIEEGMLRLM